MIVVVTGASQGIGQAIAEAFAAEYDARVALAARTRTALEQTADACRTRGGTPLVLPTDVTDDAAVADLAAAVHEEWGPPDVLVNNAGAFTDTPLDELTLEGFRDQIDVNLTSAFAVTAAFLPAMRERGEGHLFFMGSVASLMAYPGNAGYCAAKHGLRGLARTVRAETKDEGLRVTTVLPGATDTPTWDGAGVAEERLMAPEDVAQSVVNAYRLSDRTVLEELLLRPQEGDV
ncbi:NAD(P)-dependent dehydrogenase (short-subunit alcohol dehydrogenase family) [Salinibacter ruber]|uniref:SDR family oxidoreductase n=1 Tax=Salinibacter ruber TaxID=146919 RepID=UPI0021673821|nr:SDR family oxidoreductase [Salinibacter ruber]MCS3666899.1 NAD(P)-dependent dehydrogenase (short-subunit alcohol dehydrogenase family) [Salinibacter ruber]